MIFPNRKTLMGFFLCLALVIGTFLIGKYVFKRLRPIPPYEQAQHFLNERISLDQTLWSKEVMAQKYEGAVIALWDRLRESTDKWSVLGQISFEELTLGKPVSTEELDWGIQRIRYSSVGRTFNNPQWEQWLKELERLGFIFVQGEFHHKKFDYSSNGREAEARSVFSIVGHIRRASRKLMVEGSIEIEWSAAKDAAGHYIPKSINTSDITLTTWQGPTVMRETLVIEPRAPDMPNLPTWPMLLYDLDRDGDVDILLPSVNELHRNRGDGKFEKVALFSDRSATELLPIKASVIADFDGDGYADIFLCNRKRPSLLYRGNGDGSFRVPATVVSIPGMTLIDPYVATAGDVDGDGDLDIWIGQYKTPYRDGNFPTPYYNANDGYPSYLLVNQGQGLFTDGTKQAGLTSKRFRRNYSASLVDLDEDGDLDLLTVNDFAGIDVYSNDGRGHFSDVSDAAADERSLFGMAHTFGDYNLDGKMDIYVIGMSSTTARRLAYMKLGRDEFPEHQAMRSKMTYGNRMLLGIAPGRFTQAPWSDQVASTGWAWGVTSFDLDTDGDLDLYVANGHSSKKTAKDYCTVFWCHDIYTEGSSAAKSILFQGTQGKDRYRGNAVSWNPFEHNFLLMNHAVQGVSGFTNVAFLMSAAFEFDSRAVVSADLNLDGRPDLVVVEQAPPIGSNPRGKQRGRVHILENHWPRPGHWIGVQLREEPGLSAIGARIIVSTTTGIKMARIVTGDSFESQHPSIKLFGLGKIDRVDFIEVHWLNGKVRRIERPEVDRYHYVSAIGSGSPL